MKIIGLTGGIGSGKSTVSAQLSALGAEVIDADLISRKILDLGCDAYNEVVARFGDKILDNTNNIDRQSLADIVFSDKAELEALNSITHKYIFIEMNREIDKYKSYNNNNQIIILDVPLLFSSDFPIRCDKTVAVIADEDVRIRRVQKRDNCTAADVKRRIRNQISNDDLINQADYVIENNSSIEKLKENVESLYSKLKFP